MMPMWGFPTGRLEERLELERPTWFQMVGCGIQFSSNNWLMK